VFSAGISLLAMLWPVEDWALQTFTAPTDSGNASGDASGGVDCECWSCYSIFGAEDLRMCVVDSVFFLASPQTVW
jgi:hypothetical protein